MGSRNSSRRGPFDQTRLQRPSPLGPGASLLLLPDAGSLMLCVHRYWWDLPQSERDAYLENNSPATAEDEADDADANAQGAKAQDADFDAATLFRYAHARHFHSVRWLLFSSLLLLFIYVFICWQDEWRHVGCCSNNFCNSFALSSQ
jgi:hypothetical protein